MQQSVLKMYDGKIHFLNRRLYLKKNINVPLTFFLRQIGIKQGHLYKENFSLYVRKSVFVFMLGQKDVASHPQISKIMAAFSLLVKYHAIIVREYFNKLKRNVFNMNVW